MRDHIAIVHVGSCLLILNRYRVRAALMLVERQDASGSRHGMRWSNLRRLRHRATLHT